MLSEAVEAFPEVFGPLRIPERPEAFKRNYGDLLAHFEAARVASSRRAEIAQAMVTQTQKALCYVDDGQQLPLAEYMAQAESRPQLEYSAQAGDPDLQVVVPFGGKTYRGREVLSLVEQLQELHALSDAAAKALRWSVEHIEGQGGTLDLRGQRFVLFGAGAELAPTRALLRAGATVLWVDLAAPSETAAVACGGGLAHAPTARDLLREPRGIAAAVDSFVQDGGPVHVGMFAYAPGASQEWRLCAAMNAILSHLEPGVVRSVSLFISPTTVPTLQPESQQGVESQLAGRPLWKAGLQRVGLLPTPGHVSHGTHKVGRCVVSLQGVSYQAAQYVSKMAAAETLATAGLALREGVAPQGPVTVSANTAGITKTRSLGHPLFQAAFIGASQFGVRIFEPAETRALSSLLMLHDLLNEQAPGAAGAPREDTQQKAAAVFSQQVHGGVFALPYALEPAIRAAAVIGLGRKPQLLLRKSSKGKSGQSKSGGAVKLA